MSRQQFLTIDFMSPEGIVPDRRWALTTAPFRCGTCKDFLRERIPPAGQFRMYLSQAPGNRVIGGVSGGPPFGVFHVRLLDQLRPYLADDVLSFDCYSTDPNVQVAVEIGDTGDDDKDFARDARRLVDYKACVGLNPAPARCGEVVERRACPECGRDRTRCEGSRWNLWASEIMGRKVVLDRIGSISLHPDVVPTIDFSGFRKFRLTPIDVDD